MREKGSAVRFTHGHKQAHRDLFQDDKVAEAVLSVDLCGPVPVELLLLGQRALQELWGAGRAAG